MFGTGKRINSDDEVPTVGADIVPRLVNMSPYTWPDSDKKIGRIDIKYESFFLTSKIYGHRRSLLAL